MDPRANRLVDIAAASGGEWGLNKRGPNLPYTLIPIYHFCSHSWPRRQLPLPIRFVINGLHDAISTDPSTMFDDSPRSSPSKWPQPKRLLQPSRWDTGKKRALHRLSPGTLRRPPQTRGAPGGWDPPPRHRTLHRPCLPIVPRPQRQTCVSSAPQRKHAARCLPAATASALPPTVAGEGGAHQNQPPPPLSCRSSPLPVPRSLRLSSPRWPSSSPRYSGSASPCTSDFRTAMDGRISRCPAACACCATSPRQRLLHRVHLRAVGPPAAVAHHMSVAAPSQLWLQDCRQSDRRHTSASCGRTHRRCSCATSALLPCRI